MAQLKWRDKFWQVSSKKLNPADSLSMSLSYNRDEKKKEKTSVTLPYSAYLEFGVNTEAELEYWNKMLGEEGYIYCGKKKLYSSKMRLVGVDTSDIVVMDNGIVRSATFSLSFEEV